MTRYDRHAIAFAVCLTGLAGYVDALGFLSLGGFFVSFMTGNSTRLGTDLARGDFAGIGIAGGIVALFVCGVILGSLIGHLAGARRQVGVLAGVTTCLFAAATFASLGRTDIGVSLLAVAMGMENGVFQRDGEVTIGLTYMTGTLVKMGQRIAAALLGGSRTAWIRQFVLWLGLVTGVVAGAIVYDRIGLDAIWIAAGASALLTLVSMRLPLSD